mgnify:CR=1 FL=1
MIRKIPKTSKKMGRAKNVRLLETNNPELLGELDGEFGSEGMLHGMSQMQKSITLQGIARERLLRQGRKLPK